MSAEPSGRRRPLQGDVAEVPAPQPKARGWHPIDWLCEFAGTAFQLFLGFCVVGLLEDPPPLGGNARGRIAVVLEKLRHVGRVRARQVRRCHLSLCCSSVAGGGRRSRSGAVP